MDIDDATRHYIQRHFNYSDEEMEVFLDNPRNRDILAKAPSSRTR